MANVRVRHILISIRFVSIWLSRNLENLHIEHANANANAIENLQVNSDVDAVYATLITPNSSASASSLSEITNGSIAAVTGLVKKPGRPRLTDEVLASRGKEKEDKAEARIREKLAKEQLKFHKKAAKKDAKNANNAKK
jgi:hypothetical protein